LLNALLIIVLIICLFTDLRSRRIYNKVIFPVLAAAIILNLMLNGLTGLKFSLIGFITGLGILVIPFAMNGIGAGDVKLLAVIGAIKGSIFAINTSIYMALIGGGIALIIILLHRETINFFKSLFWWLIGVCRGMHYKLELPTTVFLMKFPYGVAITAGALMCLIFEEAWII
jgi:prepilin peptidase CpaA